MFVRTQKKHRLTSTVGLSALFLVTLFVTGLVVSLVQVRTVSAQAQQKVPKTLLLDASPVAPTPNSAVVMNLRSYDIDLVTALVTWSIDGEVVRSERGYTTHTITLGPAGSATRIKVTATALNGTTIVAEKVLRPVGVSISWYADSHVPPLYRGKRLHGPGGQVTFVALPTFITGAGTLNPSSLVYSWEQNGMRIVKESGLGKQSITLTNTAYLRPMQIAVVVTTQDGSLVAKGKVTVPVTQPFVVLYEQSPLLGTKYSRALTGRHTIENQEFTMVAEPYFFSVSQRDDAVLTYDWMVGGAPVDAKSVITLRPEGEGEGAAAVALQLRNSSHILQSARSAIQVLFNTDPFLRSDNPITL